MNVTASESELNIISDFYKLSEINNEKKLLEKVKEAHDTFDESRECFFFIHFCLKIL